MSILVDFSTMIIAAAFAQGKDEVDEKLLRHLVINSILSVKKKFGRHHGELILCCDSGKYWRRKVFPYYKAHRAKNREESKFDWNLFFQSFNKIKAELRDVFPYKVIELEDCEADDIIGVLALNATEDTVIYAEDGDFLQLLRNPYVKMYRPRKKAFVPQMNLHEIEWELFRKISTGDKGDGIPSCINPGNSIVEGVRAKPLRETKIEEWFKTGVPQDLMPRWEENKMLIDLREIPEDVAARILEAVKVPANGSAGKIFNFMMSKGLNQLGKAFMSEIQDF
jgi:hypothetical protein